jgi:4-hydroxy-tetrahydrodipicolinate synthase
MFELVDFLGASGVNGIVLMGTTGEFFHFTIEDRARTVSLALKRSRVPVVVNVSHSCLDGAVALAGQAAKSGAAGLLVMPPYYLRYSQAALAGFFRDFFAEAKPYLPVYLYNIPAFVSPLEALTAIELLATGLFAGIKDSSGSWENFLALRAGALERKFQLLVGSDRFYAAARSAGADGIISGCASAIPELLVALERSLAVREEPKTRLLQRRLEEFVERIEEFPATFAIKEAARVRGLKAGPTPFALKGELGDRLREFGEWFGGWWKSTRAECG